MTDGPSVPHQLPMGAGLLVGRAALLDRLDAVLLHPDGGRPLHAGRGRPRIAVLTGMVGVGKTALALRWAHRCADAFPDGQLYVDVRGFGPDPALRPREILAGFLRALGLSRAAEIGSTQERAAVWRTALNGRRILVVLDNVGSVEQIRPLLPGADSCAVLITSRERLGGLTVQPGAEILEVDRLPVDDASALLRTAIGERADADPGRTALLAARCAGLPLALRIAAEMVTSRPSDGLDALIDELADSDTALDALDTGDDPHSAVRTAFSWSYRGLTDPAAAAFRLLSLHLGNTFGLEAAAALLDLTVARARPLLRSLLNAHLVTEPVAGRFGMHDLLRAYARALCASDTDEADRLAALRRMVDHYLHTADRAGRVIMPYRHRFPLDGAPSVDVTFDDRQAALRWFDIERHNLVELCGLGGPSFDSRRWHLAYVLRDYFYLSKDLDGWLESHRLAVAGCRRLGDPRAEGLTRNNLGRALLEAGRTDAAATQYRLARDLLEEAGDQEGVTDALFNLASVLRRQGAHEEALDNQRRALAHYRLAGLPRKIGISLRSIARTELVLGRLPDAVVHAEEALARFVELGLDLDAAQTLTTLVEAYHRQGDRALAESTGERAVTYSRRAGSDYEEARALRWLGTVAADAGEVRLARERWTAALVIFRRIGAVTASTVAADLERLAG